MEEISGEIDSPRRLVKTLRGALGLKEDECYLNTVKAMKTAIESGEAESIEDFRYTNLENRMSERYRRMQNNYDSQISSLQNDCRNLRRRTAWLAAENDQLRWR